VSLLQVIINIVDLKILAPTTGNYVAQPVSAPSGAANSLAGGKLKKGVKRKADPSPINSIDSSMYAGPMVATTTPVQPLQTSIRRESGRQIKKPRVPDEGILYSQNTTLPSGSGSISVIFKIKFRFLIGILITRLLHTFLGRKNQRKID